MKLCRELNSFLREQGKNQLSHWDGRCVLQEEHARGRLGATKISGQAIIGSTCKSQPYNAVAGVGPRMKGGSLFVVGIALICVLFGAAIGFVVVKTFEARGMLGFCEAATFCPKGTFCACPEYYEPVCGFPSFKVYSNSCFACVDGAWMWVRA